MDFVIRGNHLSVTEALRNFVQHKLGRLDKFLEMNPTGDANVVLSVLKNRHKVEVTIPYPGLIVRAEETSDDMYTSIDLVVQKLERQIRKYKTKVTRKFRRDSSLQEGTSLIEQSLPKEPAEEFPVVRMKKFHFKPMDTQEAILQMNTLGHDFFVFTHADTNEVSVVYKRKDGRYGLIEPE